jgi:hypothetical protein
MKIISLLSLALIVHNLLHAQYDPSYAATGKETIENEMYSVVEMTRKDQRVKVKYFADKDASGKSVYNRYLEWSRNRSIICVSVGTYFDDSGRPVGICIDDGRIINRTDEKKMDGLVIVYKTGGIVATNIKEGNLTLQNSSGTSSVLDLKNTLDRQKFFRWAEENDATVFQTHLLYYKNEFKIGADNSSQTKRERRMLAVARDEDGNIRYYVVNLKSQNTLYNATKKIVSYLSEKTDDIIYLINLDTGYQDAMQVRRPDGKVINEPAFTGVESLSVAKNLIAFYFE